MLSINWISLSRIIFKERAAEYKNMSRRLSHYLSFLDTSVEMESVKCIFFGDNSTSLKLCYSIRFFK